MESGNVATTECEQDLEILYHTLAREVLRVLELAQRTEPLDRVVRVELAVDAAEPYAWLSAQPFEQKILWSDRTRCWTSAGAGVADLVEPGYGNDLDEMIRRVQALRGTSARYFGGVRFDTRRETAPEWEPFGTFRFVLPRFEFVERDGLAVLACNLVFPRDLNRRPQLLQEIQRLQLPAGGRRDDLSLPEYRRDVPDREGWIRNVEWGLDAFVAGTLGKVVFARKVDFGFSDDVDPVRLLEKLHTATPDCFHFCFQVDSNTAFLGASPERLFLREGREVLSEAVAGTRPRGDSAEDDERLCDELFHSQKDRLEHAYVQRSVTTMLTRLCTDVTADTDPVEMRLARGRHLLSRIRGVLREGTNDVEIIRALHPTPAVGGHPTGAALEAIREREAFDRGWYAGPIGWIGTDSAEFAVGIRSGLVRGDTLSLYSGAGIVPGSKPEAEHEEIEQKISDFIRILGLDNRRS